MNLFVVRLKELLQDCGKLQTEVSRDLNITKQKLTNWKTGYNEPSIDEIIMLAKYFNVSTDYLLGLEYKQEIDLSGLSQDEVNALLNLINVMKRN